MKEFFVGLVFLAALAVFSLVALLLYPLVMVLAFFLRFAIALVFVLFVIWALGKLVVTVYERMR